ncbi:MAG: aminotransferase class I/II-fold pyridoxal phosphate-dependent enzyme [Gemmatimonadetes bacterium]|nr:aminotransferase class I/II-fold pyridoxal phosphate-dependent enzyme [Gemmatimonadota bacterium]
MMNAARPHGGPDGQGGAVHDFSTNANACGPCPPALAAVQAADATRYPDPGYTALREVLGGFHGVQPWRIVPAGSASEFIFRITVWAARAGARRVALPLHGYGDYGQAARAYGLAGTALADAQLVWACDPASPLGTADDTLSAAGQRATVVLDRAYEPLRLSGALALDPAALDRCWQLWTPNKALGLTGLRAAYAIAPAGAQHPVEDLQALAPSWVIGSHGVALLQAWTEAAVRQWLARSLQTLRDWKQQQVALCQGLGWTAVPSQANYFTCRVGHDAADLLRLRAHGVQVRDCTSFGLPGHLRLSVQPPAAQQALRTAWEAAR